MVMAMAMIGMEGSILGRNSPEAGSSGLPLPARRYMNQGTTNVQIKRLPPITYEFSSRTKGRRFGMISDRPVPLVT